MDNRINIGGSVGGHVIAGQGNVVGGAVPVADQPPSAPRDGMAPRLGFVVDIVGFGRREAEGKSELAHRLDVLMGRVVEDVGIDSAETESSDAGDSRVLFLPVGADPSRVLPTLISALCERLVRDNGRYRDRMRLRMAVGTGLQGHGPLGFSGELIIDLHRLLDCKVLRQAMDDNPTSDLAILVTHAVHDDVIRPRYLDPKDFTRVRVEAKEFAADAWLRVC